MRSSKPFSSEVVHGPCVVFQMLYQAGVKQATSRVGHVYTMINDNVAYTRLYWLTTVRYYYIQ